MLNKVLRENTNDIGQKSVLHQENKSVEEGIKE